MHNYQTNTKRYHSPLEQRGSAMLMAVLALLIITGIYFLYGMWGWMVFVVSLAVMSIAGMVAVEIAARREPVKGVGIKAESGETQGRSAGKSNVSVAAASDNNAVKMKFADKPAAKAPISESVEPIASVTDQQSAPDAANRYRLEMIGPGKEPVQIMRLLHNELGFSAEQAKQVILNRKFPMNLAQGSKEALQEKAKKLLKVGAKLRLVPCQADSPEPVDKKAV